MTNLPDDCLTDRRNWFQVGYLHSSFNAYRELHLNPLILPTKLPLPPPPKKNARHLVLKEYEYEPYVKRSTLQYHIWEENDCSTTSS